MSPNNPLFVSTMQQRALYAAFKKNKGNGTEIVKTFKQSGLSGFLPLLFPGVCLFMTIDYARSLNHGTDNHWLKSLEKKSFIKRLIVGQLRYFGKVKNHLLYDPLFMKTRCDIDLSQGPLSQVKSNLPDVEDEIKSNQSEIPNDDFELISDVGLDAMPKQMEPHEDIYHRLTPNPDSAPSHRIDINHVSWTFMLERKGGLKSLFGNRFAHTTVFSQATKSDGTIDDEHLTFMDPNAGLFKIKNNPESIKEFLETFRSTMLSQYNIVGETTNPIDKIWLPEKSNMAAWQEARGIIDNKLQGQESYSPGVIDNTAKESSKIYAILTTYMNQNIAGWGHNKKTDDAKNKKFIKTFDALMRLKITDPAFKDKLNDLEKITLEKRNWYELFKPKSYHSFVKIKKQIHEIINPPDHAQDKDKDKDRNSDDNPKL